MENKDVLRHEFSKVLPLKITNVGNNKSLLSSRVIDVVSILIKAITRKLAHFNDKSVFPQILITKINNLNNEIFPTPIPLS